MFKTKTEKKSFTLLHICVKIKLNKVQALLFTNQ